MNGITGMALTRRFLGRVVSLVENIPFWLLIFKVLDQPRYNVFLLVFPRA